MKSLEFTVGLAVYDNPPTFAESIRAIFTIESLIHHHPMVKEIIVVDNHPIPNNPLSKMPDDSGGLVRYIPMGHPNGTAAPRNRVFEEAKYPYVCCLDPHVLLYDTAFPSLCDFYQDRGLDCPDVIHGPMMYGKRNKVYAHHMNDQWRCQMWGTWGWAWIKDGVHFSTLTRDDRTLEYVTLNLEGEQKRFHGRDLGLPDPIEWPCHEKKLEDLGCRIVNERDEPFLIPGHGMGFWCCRKDDWLPFHKDCRGFGGEEMTTGVRFRKHGRQAWCVPGCRWWHHFDRPYGGVTPYRLTTWDKARNYWLEFTRLGLDIGPIRQEFNHMVMPEAEWQMIQQGMEWPNQIPAGVNPLTFRETPEIAHEHQLKHNLKPLSKHELAK